MNHLHKCLLIVYVMIWLLIVVSYVIGDIASVVIIVIVKSLPFYLCQLFSSSPFSKSSGTLDDIGE